MGWEQLVIAIVMALISIYLAPKPSTPKPAQLSEGDVPTAEEGKEIAVVFGDVLVKESNVVWYGDMRTQPIIKDTGKK